MMRWLRHVLAPVLARDTGAALATASMAGPPDVLWVDPRHQRLSTAVGTPGVVQVLDTHAMTIAEEIHTEQGAHTLTSPAAPATDR